MRSFLVGYSVISTVFQAAAAVGLDVADVDSIKNAASIIAYDLVSYYTGNDTDTANTIARLPDPYWWWESGVMWGALIDYWHYTGDDSYNNITSQALLSQVGSTYDFMTDGATEANDDQAHWGFAAMAAAEKGFPAPPSGIPSWLQIVVNLWNDQAARWDTLTCNGGMRWQIYSHQDGYDYKNSISNGAFFQLSARLAHFTGNQTYAEWAEKAFDWAFDIGLVSADYDVWDGTDDLKNCSDFDHDRWTYTQGVYLYGAAVMYNYTNGSTEWYTHTNGLLANANATFFNLSSNSTNIMYEPFCEPTTNCNTDQLSFKAYLSRWMWATTQSAPYTAPSIRDLLQPSAYGAAQACSGTNSSSVTSTSTNVCGSKWYVGEWDGTNGVGQQLSALEVIQGLLVNETAPVEHYSTVYLKLDPRVSVANSSSGNNETGIGKSGGTGQGLNQFGNSTLGTAASTMAAVPTQTFILYGSSSTSSASTTAAVPTQTLILYGSSSTSSAEATSYVENTSGTEVLRINPMVLCLGSLMGLMLLL